MPNKLSKIHYPIDLHSDNSADIAYRLEGRDPNSSKTHYQDGFENLHIYVIASLNYSI